MELENIKMDSLEEGQFGGEYASRVRYFKAENSRLKVSHYPLCCTGSIMSGFGGSSDSYDARGVEEGLEEQVQAWVEAIDKGAIRQDKVFISALVTTEQGEAIKALNACGFKRGPEMENTVNDYNLILWTYTYGEVYEEEKS